MRKLIWISLGLALAWCIWWWLASASVRGGLQSWFDARAAEGWQAELGAVQSGGFPLTLQTRMSEIAVADPDAGLAIETQTLDISAPAWWPGNVTVTLDDSPILLASPLGRSTLLMQDGTLTLSLLPGTALEVEGLGWTAGAWRVENAAETEVQADTLTLTAKQLEGPIYDFTAVARQFAPGDPTRTRLRLPDSFPRAFDTLELRARIRFDQPWDRRALNEARPQPRRIDVQLAEARWGDLRLNLAAALDVAADGTPTGRVTLQAENWQAMLDLAQSGGALPKALRGQAEGILRLLSGASGNPENLDVALTLRDGAVYLGFLPISSAPQIVLR